MPYPPVIKTPRRLGCLLAILAVLTSLSVRIASAQQPPSPPLNNAAIQGTVADASGHPVAGAAVRLEQKDPPAVIETKTNPDGTFAFSSLPSGTYRISSQKDALRSHAADALILSEGAQKHIDLVLKASGENAAPSAQAMQFADQPNFTVAGVTDWTAAGGHGSDVGLRTSEDLARATVVLKPSASENGTSHPASEPESRLRAALAREPGSFDANHRLGEFYLRESRYAEAVLLLEAADRIDPASHANEYDLALACQGVGDFSRAREHVQSILAHEENADAHRLLGDLDEQLNDPLAAVSEDEKAVRLDPSEQNYFQWGSELLLHRAIQPAVEVFRDGARAHPKSERMLAALGAALFASGHDDEAALRLCDASDLKPSDPAPYIFLGKIAVAAPSPLPCVQPRLARFAQQQPGNAFANYYYAMVLQKGDSSENPGIQPQVETLLTKAVRIDPSFDEAWLQLGILTAAEGDFPKAIGFYEKAIAVNPKLSTAHYRLGIAYARIGEQAKSKEEFQSYNDLDKQQAAAIERQRKEIKQFLVVLKVQPAPSSNN
jgi:tetratricopeptide (TPR) repeat protein